MNIFLPYENDIGASVKALDDARLVKQVLETHQLLSNAILESQGKEIKGYKNHPVYVFYKDNIPFLLEYLSKCCSEYLYRFKKWHKSNLYAGMLSSVYPCHNVEFTPYYMEGSKGQPNYIRTTNNVSALFQQKLINKWNNDKAKGRPPKWTNRQVPEFYKKEMMKSE